MTDTLIERLEKAGEGSRELDCEIAAHSQTPAIGDLMKEADVETLLAPCAFGIGLSDDDYEGYLPETNADYYGVPHYTTNLQDALGLVPDGWHWLCHDGSGLEDHPGGFASLHPDGENYVYGRAATPALAMCVACLRALEKSDG